MYREKGNDIRDSGWRFFCGLENQAYVDNPKNIGIYDINTILNIDSSIQPYLSNPFGTSFERKDINSPFIQIRDYGFSTK